MTSQTHHSIPDFPHLKAAFRHDGSVEVTLLGVSYIFTADDSGSARDNCVRWLAGKANSPELQRPVRVTTLDPSGRAAGSLIVQPDGRYFEESDPDTVWTVPPAHAEQEQVNAAQHEPTDTADALLADDLLTMGQNGGSERQEIRVDVWHDAPQPPEHPTPPTGPAAPVGRRAAQPERNASEVAEWPWTAGQTPQEITSRPESPSPHAAGATPAHEALQQRRSFITTQPSETPAQHGWRGALNKAGFRLSPGADERAERADRLAVSQHWPGPRTIAVANPKGSATKTPTTVMLSAVMARFGGAGVLAWDNNETRGSLAWRTQQGNHTATVLDLLPKVQDLMATTAQSAEMSHFTHHQPDDRYDVLWSDQSVAGDHVVSAEDVAAVDQVASRYYRLIVMDSGNSERAPNWRAMIDRADSLVVPCTNVEDTAEAGALMLEALAARDERSAQLARNAVVIVSQRTPGKDPNMTRIARDFAPLVREVVTIPYDPALRSGVILFDSLRPETRRAWLRAAAAVAAAL